MIGTDQLYVKSYMVPIKVGPIAANRYPADCDIPKSSDAFWVFGLLSEMKAIDKLILPPIPKDISNTESAKTNGEVPIKNSNIPIK